MTSGKTHLFNKLILLTGKWNHYRYRAFANKVGKVQLHKLNRYIALNSSTVYGEAYDFKKIKDYASYAARVPVVDDWKQVEHYIQRIGKGEENILCSGKIEAFEETSGSTGFSKLIPYNKALKREFQKALQTWMLELSAELPKALSGKSYWSLSPVLKEMRLTEGGIRIGLENDNEYFDPVTSYLLAQIMAVNGSIAKMKDPHAFYFATVKQLLLRRDLSFVSVWSPTFFLQLDKFLRSNLDLLLEEINAIDRKRYNELKAATNASYCWKDIWPNLACISCWADAQAAFWIPQVRQLAGDVPIQPKGLFSTEAVISIPIKDSAYPALAYQSHFFEFRNIDDFTICLAHELMQSARYEVIVTTGGGLYRYATKDVVQVMGFHKKIPLFKFLGRQNRTSDMVGEKVSEIQVSEVLSQILTKEYQHLAMIFTRPAMFEQSGVYTLYFEFEEDMHTHQAEEITRQFEAGLCKNPYYQQALNTGQLRAMQYKVIARGFKEKLIAYYRDRKSIKDGDIKLPLLFLAHELKDLNHLL
jgi:hypothetical protein